MSLAARSAICIQLPRTAEASCTVLFEKDADRPIAPASIIKLLTAVTALRVAERKGLGPSTELKVLPDDIVGGSGRNVAEGDCFSFRHCLANLLLASSNVAANVVARSFGSLLLVDEMRSEVDPVQRFVGEMNSVACELQMTSSRFLNAHGLAVKGQRSTARDLARLVKECLQYPLITEFWNLEKYAVSILGPSARKLVVRSIFRASSLKAVPDFAIPQFRGGKSGTLWPSVFNLAAVSESVSGDLIVSVSLGSPSLVDRHRDYLAMMQIGDAVPSSG